MRRTSVYALSKRRVGISGYTIRNPHPMKMAGRVSPSTPLYPKTTNTAAIVNARTIEKSKLYEFMNSKGHITFSPNHHQHTDFPTDPPAQTPERHNTAAATPI